MKNPFRNYKELKRETFTPIHLMQGDSLRLTWTEPGRKEKILCKHTIDASQAMSIDEGILFEARFEGRRALGGITLEQKKKHP